MNIQMWIQNIAYSVIQQVMALPANLAIQMGATNMVAMEDFAYIVAQQVLGLPASLAIQMGVMKGKYIAN